MARTADNQTTERRRLVAGQSECEFSSAMASAPKPWKVEYAKSSRSTCKTCKNTIGKEVLRLGKMVTATQFDGFMPIWNHAACILKKSNQIKRIDDVEGVESLRWEDQQKLRNYVEGNMVTIPTSSSSECAIEVCQMSRASCKRCSQKIAKGNVRVSTRPNGQSSKGFVWYHVLCFTEICPSIQIEKLCGWSEFSDEDKDSVLALVNTGSNNMASQSKEACTQAPSRVSKRKNASNDELKSEANTKKVAVGCSDLEGKLEEQSKALWAIKDDLKKNVTVPEMRAMLEANGLESTGSEFVLRDRCADGMLFGALEKCPICCGSLHWSGGRYVCSGYLSAWSKCSYSTTQPLRLKKRWQIPEGTCNTFLKLWFKVQNERRRNQILPPSAQDTSEHEVGQPSRGEKLDALTIAVVGLSDKSEEYWKSRIESIGGTVHFKIKKECDCVVVHGDLDDLNRDVKNAKKMKIPVVREDYLVDCFEKMRKLPFDEYKVTTSIEKPKNEKITVKVKGKSAVHEASGLQDTGHILEEGTSIFNTTLNMSDLVTGVNSYYILQVIQEDRGCGCFVFRKWGRVGNDMIGGSKLEEMEQSDAILEFKRLFLDKTGNTWEAWEAKQNFKKQPGRFFPIEIDYGINKRVSQKMDNSKAKSTLHPQLKELIQVLFDVETYRAAMMEFEINMSVMPLGKLSKSNIQQGFEALTEIQNLLNNNDYETVVKEGLMIDASNRFFTVIPSIHPHIIRDEIEFKSKIKMLEALQDIEIASRLVGFNAQDEESLDDKYMKLHCGISPLAHNSDDYRLVEKYLMKTHAPTHKDWRLELEEVFSLEREGEYDTYAPFQDKLGNRMLLWHGSRLTNFVGILSQGLRIAPPEAPATGYMFGKGIYFADLVSKSAQYCYTDKKSPVGFLILSEVSLGEVYELKKALYMESPPAMKHSTKGLGKTIPKKSEYVTWRNGVIVPCGQPVPSSVRATELLYNEYIVYNAAQVKMQFLLKVKFHHR